MLSREASGYIFYYLWYDSAGDRTPASQSQGGHSNHKATELVTQSRDLYSRSHFLLHKAFLLGVEWNFACEIKGTPVPDLYTKAVRLKSTLFTHNPSKPFNNALIISLHANNCKLNLLRFSESNKGLTEISVCQYYQLILAYHRYIGMIVFKFSYMCQYLYIIYWCVCWNLKLLDHWFKMV